MILSYRVLCLAVLFSLSFFAYSCGEACDPACRDGYECMTSGDTSPTCVSVCNPECASGEETCNSLTGQCE